MGWGVTSYNTPCACLKGSTICNTASALVSFSFAMTQLQYAVTQLQFRESCEPEWLIPDGEAMQSRWDHGGQGS
jgi:hypothetical protein